jgi:hypothetical protein
MRRPGKALAVVVVGVLVLAGSAVLPTEASAAGGGSHGGFSGGHSFHSGSFHGGNSFHGHFHNGHFHNGHFRHGSGVFIGGAFIASPWWWGAPYPYYPYWGGAYPYYAYAPPVVEQPLDYVQGPLPGAQSPGYWYYCESARAYYPNVPSCPENWIQVPARPQ